ncbi:MAG: two-component sensor histidine kinase [Myxococcaceae bacterium]|nr:two-component sensor histidine kinase [Myxococcaceae bacterium]
MLSVWASMHLLAATSSVVVVALALSRHSNPTFRLPLVLVAVDQFVWNVAAVGDVLTGDPAYKWLGALVTPVFGTFGLHFLLAFTGRLARFRRLLGALYLLFAVEAVLVLLDWRTSLVHFEGGLGTHAIIAAVSNLPVVLFGTVLLRGHLREVVSESERQRTWLFIIAIAVGVPLLLTDLFFDMGLDVPPLATAGGTVLNTLFIVITLGVSNSSRRQQLGQATLLALVVVVSFLTLFNAFRDRQGVLVLSMTVLTLALAAGARLAWQMLARRNEGLTRFATLGRFSAQMAHDLKNPLAAARGAAELLEGEVKALGKDELSHFSALLVQQLDRLTAIIDRYQRLSRMELERQPVDVNELVARVLSLQAFAQAGAVTLTSQLEPGLPKVSLDPELVSSVLENLVKNAFEAMPGGGTVTVSTARRENTLTLAVTDTGPGMDPRTREQAFQLFFTTKASGSGLGLAFVKQIALAHGGDVRLDSHEGKGTRVELRLPCA